jgi:hypothetical protein
VQRYRVRPRETDQLVSQAENEIAAMRTLVKSAQQEYHKLGQQLFAANEKLREVDSDLHALQKSQLNRIRVRRSSHPIYLHGALRKRTRCPARMAAAPFHLSGSEAAKPGARGWAGYLAPQGRRA